ncbi:MAG: cation transporter [Candidatus Omnitrophica bacterium]|nr:cation transporter [Candidatus Omnitrophota bacterium]
MTIHPHRREGPSGALELRLALLITFSFFVVELVAGIISGSLALLADAGHMLTDVSALSLSLFAAWIATKPATSANTYGYYRTEILAALVNGVALWLLVAWIYVRALHRLQDPPAIQTTPMLAAAVLGLCANLASSRVLARAPSLSLNIQGARLNVLADALGSCGVIAAGVLIRWKDWRLADPLASLFIGFLIALSSWGFVKQSVGVLLEASPAHLDTGQIVEAMRRVAGVRDVHDLHVWTITTGLEAMSGHILVDDLADGPAILDALNRALSDQFGITHTTFQAELYRQKA